MFKFYKNGKQILAYDDILDESGKTNIIVDTSNHINPYIGIASITNHSRFLLEVGGERSKIYNTTEILDEAYFDMPFHAYSQFSRKMPVWVGWNLRNPYTPDPEIQTTSAGLNNLIQNYYSLMPLLVGENEISILQTQSSSHYYDEKTDEVFYLVCVWGEKGSEDHWQIPFRNKKYAPAKFQVLKRIDNV